MKNYPRAVASILLFLFCFTAFAEDWSKLHKDFQQAKSHDEAVATLGDSVKDADDKLIELLDDYDSAINKKVKDTTYNSIDQYLAVRSLSERFSAKNSADETAKSIKKDPIYAAQKEATSSNWLQKMLDRLKNMFDKDSSQTSEPTSPPPGWILPAIRVLFIIFCVAVVGLLIFLLTKIPWSWTKSGRSKKLRKGGMLEEGEQLLSEDEYLREADRLVAEGKFREACRALFLASLLRIDKARIARFEPTQTNWEHLRRIETSSIRPQYLEFRAATKAFDHAWYGNRAKYADDVMIFRETYVSIKSMTEGMV